MAQPFRVLVNHIGYDSRAPKRAVVQVYSGQAPTRFRVVNDATDEAVYSGAIDPPEQVDQWHCGRFATIDFPDVRAPGCYRVEAQNEDTTLSSSPFTIDDHLLVQQTVSDIIAYFKGQRHTRLYDDYDGNAAFAGEREGTADVRGGWCDATADWSCNLSHLNYANYMNPQQAPLPVWTMLAAADLLQQSDAPAVWQLLPRLREEAAWGADKLVRMLDPAGYFYEMAIYSRKESRTILCDSTYGWTREKRDTYAAGWRQGGGMAIAALARAAAAEVAYDFAAAQYLDAAQRAFAHLVDHSLDYLNDGRENIIDDYCALLAACELHLATGEPSYAAYADTRAESLLGRITENGWLRADDEGARPFFHAAEEGMPLVALQRYQQLRDANVAKPHGLDCPRLDPRPHRLTSHLPGIPDAMQKIAEFQRRITGEVSNPFSYARQIVKAVHEPEMRTAFFMPHDNETEYWWQGENARIASLAAAQLRLCRAMRDEKMMRDVAKPHGLDCPRLDRRPHRLASHVSLASDEAVQFAQRQIDWVLGLNPFDVCMLHGKGRNNVDFSPQFPNAPGGIYNGITAGVEDERDIAFMSGPHGDDPHYTWRWNEQWIPHAAWFLLAVVEIDAALER